MIKRTSPRLANLLNEDTDLPEALNRKDQEVTEYSFKNTSAEGIKRERLTVYGCVFASCNFIDCKFLKGQFADIIFNHCDLSNINFSGSHFTRVEFNGCKLTGTNFSDASFSHVLFKECRGEYINLSGSKQRNTLYQQCILRGGAFDNCLFNEVGFDASHLIEAEFYHTSLKGIDLSNSQIDGLRTTPISGSELRGTIVNSFQAVELIRMLGITIKD